MTEGVEFEGDMGPADEIPGDPGDQGGSGEEGELAFDPTEVPEAADGYDLGDRWEPPSGVEWGAERQGRVLARFHELGLNQRQTREVLNLYGAEVSADELHYQGAAEAAAGRGLAELKSELGDRYDVSIQAAARVFRDMAGGEAAAAEFAMLQLADGSVLGDNPTVIKFLVRVAEQMQTRRELAETHPMGSSSTENLDAADEIERLQADPSFVDALTSKGHPQHDSALRRWEGLIRLKLGSDADRPTPL